MFGIFLFLADPDRRALRLRYRGAAALLLNGAGVTSATVNTGQLGGSIGTALLNIVAASATAAYITAPRQVSEEYICLADPMLPPTGQLR